MEGAERRLALNLADCTIRSVAVAVVVVAAATTPNLASALPEPEYSANSACCPSNTANAVPPSQWLVLVAPRSAKTCRGKVSTQPTLS